jgi:hypothetical protein
MVQRADPSKMPAFEEGRRQLMMHYKINLMGDAT